MVVQSANFGFLRAHDPQLVRLGALAERYFREDPNTCLIKLRQFGELLAMMTAARFGIYGEDDERQVDFLRRLRDDASVAREILQLFHQLRREGNEAAHEFAGDHGKALTNLKIARQLAIWFHRSFGEDKQFRAGAFVPPPDPAYEATTLKEELARLREALEESRTAAERSQAAAEEEASRRLTAEERAEKEAEERAVWEVLAQEADAAREEVEAELATLQSAAATQPTEAIQQSINFANDMAKEIDLDEADTRRIIDAQLRQAGWEADSEKLTFTNGVRPQKGRNVAIAEWPTASGPADYVLFAGLQALAVVEAKRKAKDVPGAVDQAKRYSRGYVVHGDEVLPGGPWGEYKVPFVFATNGRPYLRQIETKSGIWFCDVRRSQNLRRAMEGWYTPQGLLETLRQDIDEAHEKLKREGFNYGFKLRDYQERAIRAVETALERGERRCLLAMATGTGKTATCIALAYRLLKTRRFRRVLFLVDRSALGQQAIDAFKTMRMESLQRFADIFDLKELGDITPDPETKVHVATVQGFMKRILYPSEDEAIPPVDQYDCVVVDECHRGYLLDREMSDAEMSFRDQRDYLSKYRRVVEHFDAVKIGLTATPALHTVEIFGEPIYQYSYREAVIDGWLIDHEPPIRIVTELAEEGIKWKPGEEIEYLDTRTGKIDLVHAPDEISMEVEDFNRRVVTTEFNRVVCEELAKNLDPTLPEKTLVFCVNDHHADIAVNELKKALATRYGEVDDDAVLKITGAADKPQQLIRRYRNEQLPNIAVTVDLLTTGIDVPKICNLVFIRRVNSRILFEQMLGRATRLCDEIGKDVFHIFDAVGLYEMLENLTDMRPVVVNPKLPFEQLIEELMTADNDDARQQLKDQIIAKLQRTRRHMSGEVKERCEDICGLRPEGLLALLRKQSAQKAVTWFGQHPDLGKWLDAREGELARVVAVSRHKDRLRRVERGYGEASKPEDYLESFRAFLGDNMNKVPALLVVTQRPRELTRRQLKELALLLDQAGFSETNLQTAWRDMTNEDIAATIIGFIRQAALGDPLVPYQERVERAIKKVLSSRQWSPPQRKWLERIGKQLRVETVVDREALNRGEFRAQGGFNRINKVFDGQLETILGDIKEVMWKDAS